jgi:hypothetical protein
MSKYLTLRGDKELAALNILESSIKQLASEFLGQSALNFYHESELSAYLIASLRSSPTTGEYINKIKMHLAHLEWPCLAGCSIDLVIWKPSSCKIAIEYWWDRSLCAKKLPLLAAVQVKRGPGRLTSLPDTNKDLKDLENVYDSKNLGQPVLYFLEWVDHGVQEHQNDREKYQDVQRILKKWSSEALDRRVFLISRDKMGFAYPEGAWLVEPLPAGVKENID